MKVRIFSVISFLAFAVLYVHTATMVIIILPFAYMRSQRVVRYLVQYWAKAVFWILGKKLEISGLENYSPGARYLIIANHASLFDIMAIMSFYPDVAWFGHERLTKVPIFNQILKMINYVPVRETNLRNTKKMLDDIIQKSKQHTLAIFPEGTRTLDGNMSNFFRGFIYILRASDINILPVTLKGFYSLKPKNRFYINFSAKISVVINKAIDSEELKQKTDHDILNEMRTVIESGNLQASMEIN